MEVRIPGRVWYNALDPMATSMQNELGLPQPRSQTRGRGFTMIYEEVTPEVANELADYLGDRASTLLSQWGIEPADRELYHAMHQTSFKIRRDAEGLKTG